MTDRSLMLVTAHPDDEAFGSAGTIHRTVAEGGRVAIVCATRGDAGEIADPALATPETLGPVREGELRTACALMGVEDLTILGYGDGAVADVDQDDLVGRIVREIRRFRPTVIATFEANGGYGHPDHMAVHRATLAAFERAGSATAYPEHVEQGMAPFRPGRALGLAFPRSLLRDLSQSTEDGFRPGGDAATIPLDEMGTPDADVAFRVHLSESDLDRKLRVLHAHATQMAPGNPITSGDPAVIRRWLSTESFSQLAPPRPSGEPVHDSIFAGLSEA